MMTNQKKKLATAIALTPLLFSGLASAQIEEILVTAEKRAESIQDVPLSVAAVGGEDVRVGKVTGLNDIAFKTPGLTFNQFNVGEPRIYIRGIGNSADSAASDQAVGTFLDEVYIGRTGGVSLDLFDLERIEILRGPQGTLYGKNTNGGAVNIVTSRPSQEPEIKLRASVGNHGLKHIQALANGGLTDSVAGKLVVSAKERDGFGKNVITENEVVAMGDFSNSPIIGNSIGAGNSGEDLDNAENLGVRAQLLVDLSDSASLLLGADYAKDETNGSCRHLKNLSEAGPLASFWTLQMSEAYNRDDRNCSSQFDTGQEREVQGLLARYEMELDWGTFTSISAWRESDYSLTDDLTGIPLIDLEVPTPPPLAAALAAAFGVPEFVIPTTGLFTSPENVIDAVEEEASQFSQEFRLNGSTDNFTWVAGAFYMQEDVERDEEFYTRYSTLVTLQLPLANEGDVLFTQDNTTTSMAVYGQIDWHINEQWTFTYGLRWSDDEKEITQNSIDLMGSGFPTGVPLILPEFPEAVRAKDSWSEVTDKYSLSYKPSEDLLFYATYSEGFKSGAFPSSTNLPTVAGQTVDPEIVENIEFGMKSTWWGGRAQFNLSRYSMDYKDLQIFELTSTLLLVLNNAQAESDGFEIEFNLMPVDNLMLSSSYNHSNAKFIEYVTPAGGDRSGNELPYAPDKSLSVALDYSIEMGESGTLDFGLSYDWKDEYYFNASNAPKTLQSDVELLGANIRWTSSDGTLDISAWGKNLGDEQQLSNQIVDPTGITTEMYMPPETYGLTVTKSF